MNLLTELKRRKVFRVTIAYAVLAWLLIEVSDTVFPRLGLPEWTVTLVIALLLLGFPLAIFLAWAYDLTPDGIRRDAGGEAPAAVPGAAPSPDRARRRAHAAWLAVGVVLAVAVGGWIAIGRTGDPAVSDAADAPTAASRAGAVAVLPFDNFGDAGEDYFSDGITEDIIAQLTRVPGLTVVSRTSAMRYRNTDLSLKEIGGQLSADVILEGSVRRAGGRVRIVAQLIDVATDTHLWAETYDREVEDIFAVQTEVAREIASALGRTLGPAGGGARAGVAPTDPETYELYLRGRHLWHQRRADALYGAIEYFRRVVERDPGFALGHLGLAETYITLPFADTEVNALEWVERGQEAVRRALALDPDLGEAHAILGLGAIVTRDWDAAEHHLVRALELTPGYSWAHHWYGVWRAALGRNDDALRHVGRALELDPLSTRGHRDMGLVLLWAGRPAEALVYLDRGAEMNPAYSDYHLVALIAHIRLGQEAEAFEELLRIIALSPAESVTATELRSIFAGEGLRAALAVALRSSPSAFGLKIYRAGLELYLGDEEAALRTLEAAVDGHDAYSAWIPVDPMLTEPLRDEPRFRALVERLDLPRP
jgi:adenylate cyclase